MEFLNSFLFHQCSNLIPLCMIVLLKFNSLYDMKCFRNNLTFERVISFYVTRGTQLKHIPR